MEERWKEQGEQAERTKRKAGAQHKRSPNPSRAGGVKVDKNTPLAFSNFCSYLLSSFCQI
ncbi:hypothetical protein RQM65_01760 [Pricia sp. S334]|uniref:Small EDRK-rich factor-like N-terminal domain-containing protein n=1 Tax=Pricia mediterranea TaxID=3076079 RepID=A0ABU3L0Y0_9FLAO|nr:hypothetical protein [Pricia sp. S334]MDT7827389.1 hypothetical protein [Pricia sp. S334]